MCGSDGFSPLRNGRVYHRLTGYGNGPGQGASQVWLMGKVADYNPDRLSGFVPQSVSPSVRGATTSIGPGASLTGIISGHVSARVASEELACQL